MVTTGRILLICDDEEISRYLREQLIIEGKHSVSFETSGQGGLGALRQNDFDAIIVKAGISDLDTVELIKGLKKINPNCVIILLADESGREASKDFSQLGVYESITRPINPEKLLFLVKKAVELHSLIVASEKLKQSLNERNASLEKQNILLAKRIEDSTKSLTRLYEDLRTTYMRTIKVLAQAIDARDHYTHSHSENVAKFAIAIAEEMKLSIKEIETIGEACELHDLGKIGIEDDILGKVTPLNEQEWEQIKRHPMTAAQILEPLTFLNEVIELISQHHEHYDGLGYPEARHGEDILLGARIIHLADAYEAMRSVRSYRKVPFSKEEAVEEIKKNSGKQFDPKVVEAFLRVVDKL